jgi:hypothetical protein
MKTKYPREPNQKPTKQEVDVYRVGRALAVMMMTVIETRANKPTARKIVPDFDPLYHLLHVFSPQFLKIASEHIVALQRYSSTSIEKRCSIWLAEENNELKAFIKLKEEVDFPRNFKIPSDCLCLCAWSPTVIHTEKRENAPFIRGYIKKSGEWSEDSCDLKLDISLFIYVGTQLKGELNESFHVAMPLKSL